MIALSSKNEKKRFNLAYCEIKKAERAEVQRNRYYSPRSTAWASEGERSHAGLKVFEARCRGAILHASLAENVLSPAASFSVRLAEGREPDGVPEAKRSKGQQPLRQTCSGLGSPRIFFTAASYEQLVPCRCIGPRRRNLRLRAFPRFGPMRTACDSAPSPLRPYASSFLPAVSILSSSASALSRVSSFANT